MATRETDAVIQLDESCSPATCGQVLGLFYVVYASE